MLLILMVFIVSGLFLVSVSTYLLYQTGVQGERQRLSEIAQSQASLMKAVGAFNQRRSHGSGDRDQGFRDTLDQFREAHKLYLGMGETGEFTLARLEEGQIVFLLDHRHADLNNPQPVPLQSKVAEPMRQALLGKSGTLIGLDYRGVVVLAAFESLKQPYQLGIVAKIDLAEIRRPYLQTAAYVTLLTLLVGFVGTYLIIRLSGKVLVQLQQHDHQLADSLRNERLIFENIGAGIFFVKKRRIYRFNQKALELFGYQTEELLEMDTLSLYASQEGGGQVGQLGYPLVNGGQVFEQVAQVKHKDGHLFWCNIIGKAINPKDEKEGSVWILEDVTERQWALSQLTQEKNFSESIIEGVGDTIFMFDPTEGKAVRWNSAFTQVSGYTDQEIAQKKAPEGWYEPDDLKKAQAALASLAVGEVIRVEIALVDKSGEKIPTEYRAGLIPKEAGEEGYYVLSVGRDLRPRIEAEKKLQKQEQQAQKYLDRAGVLLFALDAEQQVVMINKKGCEILGYEESEMLGKNWFDCFLLVEDVEAVKAVYRQLMSGEVEPVEYHVNPIRTKSGGQRLIEWHNFLVFDDVGNAVGIFSSGLDITEQDTARREMEKSQWILEKMEEIAQIGAWSYDLETQKLFHSQGTLRIHEVKETPELQDAIKFYAPSTRPVIKQAITKLIEDQTPFDLELDFITASGKPKRVRSTGKAVLKDGEVVQLLGGFQDVTESAKIRQDIEFKKHRTQAYLDTAGMVMIALDTEQKVMMINREGCKVLETSEEEVLGENWFQQFHCAENSDEAVEVYQQILHSESHLMVVYESLIKTKSGKVRLMQWRNKVLTDERGETIGVLNTGLDVTEQSLLEDKLAYSEEQLRTLLSSSQDAIVTIDQDDQVIFWNQAAFEIFGYSQVEMVGKSISTIIHDVSNPQSSQMFAFDEARLTSKPVEMVGIRKDQVKVSVELSLSSWEMRGQTFYTGILRDISERKRSQEETRHLTHAMDQVDEIVFITDLKGHLTYWNPAFHQVPLVFPREIFSSGYFLGKIGPIKSPLVQDICYTLKQGRRWHGEWSLETSSGDLRYFEFTVSPQNTQDGQLLSIFFIGLESTRKRKEAASQIQAQKLQALGTLSSGLAHEINNPITYVYSNIKELSGYLKGYKSLVALYRKMETKVTSEPELLGEIQAQKKIMGLSLLEEDLYQVIEDSLEGAQRLKSIVQNLKEFSRSDSGTQEWTDINHSLKQTLQLIQSELKNRVQVKENFGELPHVYCNRQEVNQVFLNLLVNASQAIIGQGEIEIRTYESTEKVAIEIIDNGPGIETSLLPRIFEPFFTTKEVGLGLGLGLSVSYNIIKKQGGEIEAQSQEGLGSRFTVWLPIKPLVNPANKT